MRRGFENTVPGRPDPPYLQLWQLWSNHSHAHSHGILTTMQAVSAASHTSSNTATAAATEMALGSFRSASRRRRRPLGLDVVGAICKISELGVLPSPPLFTSCHTITKVAFHLLSPMIEKKSCGVSIILKNQTCSQEQARSRVTLPRQA